MLLPITAPYRADAMDVLGRTHRQVASARITSGATVTEVGISDGTVSFSEDWTPHQKFTVTSPALSAVLAAADPRTASKIEVLAGYVYAGAGGEDVQVLATGHIRKGSNDQPGDAHAMDCVSEEMRTQDSLWMGTRQTKSFAGVLEAITWMLDYACPTPQTITTTMRPAYRADLVTAVAMEPGKPLWDQIYAITLAAGLWVYVDSTGAWRMEPRATAASESAAVLREGPASLVKKITHTQDLDPYYTAAILQYKWKDSGGVDREIFGTWAPPPGSKGIGAGQKVFQATRDVQSSQFDANEAARLTVQQLSTRGDSYVVEAVAAYWIRPGHTVSIGTEDIRHIVKTISFDLGAGTMTLTTREPTNLGES
jgi:hypothetical protein